MSRGFNVLTPLAPEDLVFCALTGDEELSRLFDFPLELRCPRPDLDFDARIVQSLMAENDLPYGGTRYLNGQCAHFAATGKSDRESVNALRFEDKKGEEELWLHAERNQRIEVENHESHSVGGNRSITVDSAHTVTIEKDTTLTVSEGDHLKTVSQGTQTNTVKGDITVESQSGKYTLTAATEITLKVGGSSIVMPPGHITLKSEKSI
jgi:uncharacterized protein involved in type VI secretion and phage assembly